MSQTESERAVVIAVQVEEGASSRAVLEASGRPRKHFERRDRRCERWSLQNPSRPPLTAHATTSDSSPAELGGNKPA